MAKVITTFSRTWDSMREYVSDSPSPKKFASLLKRVDQGEVRDLCLLQAEMEAKSPHYQGVCAQRRQSLTGLDWEIVPSEHVEEEQLAQEAADFCFESLNGLKKQSDEYLTFDELLDWLSLGIGPNLSVAENVWETGAIAGFVPVPPDRYASQPYEGVGVYIITDAAPLGVPTSDYGKFICYKPQGGGWHPFRRTLTHASAMAYLIIHFSVTDWAAFNELYGTPIRTAKYEAGVVGADRTTVLDMLENMGADTATAIPAGIEIELLHAQGKGETFQAMLEWAEKKLSICWLGQTLTTDIGDKGSYAAASVHDNVRGDILASDLKAEGKCIREYLLRPMVELKYPKREAPVPVFRRKLVTKRDSEGERLDLEQLRMARELKLPIDEETVYDKLRLPKPTGKVLEYAVEEKGPVDEPKKDRKPVGA